MESFFVGLLAVLLVFARFCGEFARLLRKFARLSSEFARLLLKNA